MSVPFPRCGDEQPHERHPFGSGFDYQACPGWTAAQAAVRYLVTYVPGYLLERYGPVSEYPRGLRLEMHPSVSRLLMMDADLWLRPGREATLDDFFPVPVKVTTDLPPGSWRLVIVTEETLAGGKVPGS